MGDPTEGALLVAAAKGGINRGEIETSAPRLTVLPFDSDRKRMTVVRRQENAALAFTKGAPEIVLARCAYIQDDGDVRPLTDEDRAVIHQSASWMAQEALRILAVAQRSLPDSSGTADEIERELIFLGLFGLQDPPRAEAKSAVARCRSAGIKTVMITGDHPDTATAIAHELGILQRDDKVVTGHDLERMSDSELAESVKEISVYARVTAEDKLRIVRAWKAGNKVVAMTGDGVNDAPALKEAAIGIAMGQTGTEVTKEASTRSKGPVTSVDSLIESAKREVYSNRGGTRAVASPHGKERTNGAR